MEKQIEWWLWQGCSSTRHRSGFPWAPPTQDTGRCSTEMFIGVNRQIVFAELVVYWSWQSLLLECVCWWLVYPGVPWLLMHPRCAAPPSQSPISLTQARWGCKPAINNTHPPLSPTPNWGWGESPASPTPPPHPPSKQTEKKTHTGLSTGLPYLQKKPDSLQGFHT